MGMADTIPAKMIMEIPLPIFCSVINSPSQTMTIEAAVKMTMLLNNPKIPLTVITFWNWNNFNIPKACIKAKGIVNQRVQFSNFFLPSAPSS